MTNDETPRKSLWNALQSCAGTSRDRRNSRRFTLITALWALSYVGAHRLLKSDAVLAPALNGLFVAIPILLMIAAVISYMHYLRNADELLRQIQLQGLAMGFGAGVVFVTGYQLLEAAGANEMQTDNLLVVMVAGWMAGQVHGLWRYR